MHSKKKYMGANYIEAQRKEFMSLEYGDWFVVEYEVEFLRLSRYARVVVTTEYGKCRFVEGLQYELRVLIASQRERVFAIFVNKVKAI